MIAVFLPQNIAKGYKYPNYEIYCNPEGDEYITRVRHATDGKEIKWSSTMICNLDKVDNIRYFDYGLPERFKKAAIWQRYDCLLYTSTSPRDRSVSRMPSSA